MTDDRFVCSKMFTDLNIKLPYNGIKNCCKSNEYNISESELVNLHNNSLDIFIHNSEYVRRKIEMIEYNQLPKHGCDTCINAEPNSLFRTWNTWSKKDISRTRDDLIKSINFETYELVLSSACDLKCIYCHPKDSSSWAKELGVPMNRGSIEWETTIMNALFDHLKKRTYESDKTYWFYFSGGEPTYNPQTLELIEKIVTLVPNPHIVISTNGNTKPKVMNQYVQSIRNHSNVKWTFDCSVDAVLEQAEAIRYGLKWNSLIHNISILAQEPNVEVAISPTVNMYSIPGMYDFVVYFHTLFLKNNLATKHMFNFNMVQEPDLSPWSMPSHYAINLQPAIEYCNHHGLGFETHLRNVKELIGTRINAKTAAKVDAKWKYFQQKRPDIDWAALFPHVPQIIRELNEKNIDIR